MRSYRLRTFKDCLARLPESIQALAQRKYELFLSDPHHPALKRHPIKGERHEAIGREEVYIDIRHRAVFRRGSLPGDDATVYIWEWIGTKESFVTRFHP